MKFRTMIAAPVTRTTACITAKSLPRIAVTIKLPTPGHPNTVSTTNAPFTNCANNTPATVTIGKAAFRSACLRTTERSSTPFLLATRTYSESSYSIMELRETCVSTPIGRNVNAMRGSIQYCTPPAPEVGRTLRYTANTAMQVMPTQKSGTLRATSDVNRVASSVLVPLRAAQMHPIRTPTTVKITVATAASLSVAG